MKSVGRNDLCPCGSGKKYKRCCDAPPIPRDLTPLDLLSKRLRLLLGEHRDAMRRFVDREYGIEFIDVAWQEFCAPGIEIEFDLPVDFDPATPFAGLFLRWFEHHWRPNPDDDCELDADVLAHSPTGVFLSREGAVLDPLLREYLERCVATRARFFEVTAIDRDHGITVRPLTGGQDTFVHHTGLSRAVAVHEVLYAHIVAIQSIALFEAVSPLALRADVRQALVVRLAALAQEYACPLGQLAETRENDLRELFLEYLAEHLESGQAAAGGILRVDD